MNKDMDWKFTEEIDVWVIDRKKMITLLIIREMPKKSKTKNQRGTRHLDGQKLTHLQG